MRHKNKYGLHPVPWLSCHGGFTPYVLTIMIGLNILATGFA